MVLCSEAMSHTANEVSYFFKRQVQIDATQVNVNLCELDHKLATVEIDRVQTVCTDKSAYKYALKCIPFDGPPSVLGSPPISLMTWHSSRRDSRI